MLPKHRRISATAPVACLLLTSFAPQAIAQNRGGQTRITQAVDDNRRVPLSGSRHRLARPEFDRGAAPENLAMERMLLVLSRSAEQESALNRLLDEQQDKASANYHKWLTPDEFGERFGPALEDIQTVVSWLQSHGLQVARVARGRGVIEFSGSARQVNRAFHTDMRRYSVNGEEHWANASVPEIPTALMPVIAGLPTLHNFHTHPQSVARPDPARVVRRPGAPPAITLGNGAHALSPADYAVLYQINPLYQAGVNGTGAVIGVVGRSNIDLQDIAAFRSLFLLPVNPPQVILNGPDPGIVSGEALEAVLDVSWSGAVAPNATIKLVVSKSTATTDGVLLSDEYIVDNNLADIMTISFGDCEANATSADATILSNTARQAAAQGITRTVSSGDTGSAGCDLISAHSATHPVSVNILASNAYSVAVGGTQFNENNNNAAYWSGTNGADDRSAIARIPENAWNQSCPTCNNIIAGGGGASAYYAKPPWQTGVPGIPDNNLRNVPDVSLTASSAHDPYAICSSGSCTPDAQGKVAMTLIGGTSASAPAFAGMLALVRQAVHGRLGQANYILYRLAAAQQGACDGSDTGVAPDAACIFNDITAGNIAVPGVPGYGTPSAPYQTGAGYDPATGLGSVNATKLVEQWTSATFAPSNVSFSLAPTVLNRGSLANISIQVSSSGGVPTGGVSLLSITGKGLGAFTLSGGSVNSIISMLEVGSYDVFAHYAGDGTIAPGESLPVPVTVTGPVAQPSPASLSFGGQGQNIASAPKTVTLVNSGNGNLDIGSIGFGGTNPGDFSQTNNCGAAVAPGASCAISVVFLPTVLAAHSATLRITDNGADSPQTVTLTGTGVGVPAVTFSLPSLDFGAQPVGSATAAQMVTLTNTGNGSLTVSPTITGANAADFAKTTTCGFSLAAGASCSFSLTFKPTAAGSRTAALSIADNAPGSPHTVSLSGSGIGVPKIAFNPTSLAFLNQTVGIGSAVKTVTVSNPGTATANIGSIAVSGTDAGDFTISATTCGATLAPGTTCSMSVVFNPAATGPRSAAIAVADDAAGSPQSVPLSGAGVLTPKVAFSPASLAFSNQQQGTVSVTKTATLTNTGNGTLNIVAIALTGANAAEFAQTNDCPAAIPAGGSCVISTVFQPASPGLKAAIITVTDDASGSPHKITLSATGVGAPNVVWSVPSLDFGSLPVGSATGAQVVTLSNTGNGPLTISASTLTGVNAADFTKTQTCSTPLAAGASCTYSIVFKPAATGSRSGGLTLTDNAPGSPHTVPLTGIGTGVPKVSLSPITLAFGSQTVGTPSAAKGITLTNTGTATLNIGGISSTGPNAADFTVSANTCGATLAQGATCVVSIIYNPAAAGGGSATLAVSDSAAGSPHTASLSGSGVLTPQLTLGSASLSFGNQTQGTASAPRSVTLTNSGNGVLNISSIALTGPNATEFGNTTTCGSTVAAGATCTVSPTFQPASPGSKTATLLITDNAAGSPHAISLLGTGLGVPIPSFSAASLDFGLHLVGSASLAQTITLTNTGNAALSIVSTAITGANPLEFTKTTTCLTGLAPGVSCSFSVTFKPTAAGIRTATLSVTDNAAGSPQGVLLTGNGQGVPKIGLPLTVTFANQTVGTASPVRVLTMSNPGTATLTIGSIGIAGVNAADYTISASTCGAALAPAATCTLSLVFSPAAAGVSAATLAVSDDAAGSPHSVSLSGTGVLTPKVSLSVSSFGFGSQTQGTVSAPKTAVLTNIGNGTLNIASISMAGTNPAEFAVSGSTCGGALAAGSSCTVPIVFQPASPGSKAATVSIADDAAGAPHKITMTGTGLGIPVASLSSAGLDFGAQTVGTAGTAQVVTLTNTGNGTLSITGIVFTGANTADFIKTTTCGANLLASASCTVSVTFKPAALGGRTAALSITNNAAGSPHAVVLTGSGQ